MKKKVAVLTTIFPMKQTYLMDFFKSLQLQSEKKFDIVVVNDGYTNLKSLTRCFGMLRIIELKHRQTPAKNREFGINYCLEAGYDVIVFGDSDDFFDRHRVRCSLRGLHYCDIVINDMVLVDNHKKALDKNYLSRRIEDRQRIDRTYIKEKNIFGLSNTAINTKKIKHIILPSNLVAVDWYLFSVLLYDKRVALFLQRPLTFYRQYCDNTVGIGSQANQKKLDHIISVKRVHYDRMRVVDTIFEEFFEKYALLEEKRKNGMKIEGAYIKNPLWWEEV